MNSGFVKLYLFQYLLPKYPVVTRAYLVFYYIFSFSYRLNYVHTPTSIRFDVYDFVLAKKKIRSETFYPDVNSIIQLICSRFSLGGYTHFTFISSNDVVFLYYGSRDRFSKKSEMFFVVLETSCYRDRLRKLFSTFEKLLSLLRRIH